MIAALYVETGGCYYGLPNIDPWDKDRDARKYAGPYSVIAHPPCQLWTNLAAVNYKRYGGYHNKPGNDGNCFWKAFRAVMDYGGVLEHPAGSKAYEHYGILTPQRSGGWHMIGKRTWVCEVWQSAYGHKARKRTWLLYTGNYPPPDLDWSRNPGTHQIGWFDRNKPTLSKKEAIATPIPFRDMLIDLAEHAAK